MQLTLHHLHWYGMTMWPGYAGTYYSPVRILHLDPLKYGNGTLRLSFLNLCYASGVQEMEYTVRMLRRQEDYILAAVTGGTRSICIEPLTRSWMMHHHPSFYADQLFLDDGSPCSEKFLKLAWTR